MIEILAYLEKIRAIVNERATQRAKKKKNGIESTDLRATTNIFEGCVLENEHDELWGETENHVAWDFEMSRVELPLKVVRADLAGLTCTTCECPEEEPGRAL